MLTYQAAESKMQKFRIFLLGQGGGEVHEDPLFISVINFKIQTSFPFGNRVG